MRVSDRTRQHGSSRGAGGGRKRPLSTSGEEEEEGGEEEEEGVSCAEEEEEEVEEGRAAKKARLVSVCGGGRGAEGRASLAGLVCGFGRWSLGAGCKGFI